MAGRHAPTARRETRLRVRNRVRVCASGLDGEPPLTQHRSAAPGLEPGNRTAVGLLGCIYAMRTAITSPRKEVGRRPSCFPGLDRGGAARVSFTLEFDNSQCRSGIHDERHGEPGFQSLQGFRGNLEWSRYILTSHSHFNRHRGDLSRPAPRLRWRPQ
jgi:hypothetical protein